MLEKLRQMEENFLTMQEKMTDPEVIADNRQYAELMREYKHLEPIMGNISCLPTCRTRLFGSKTASVFGRIR